ncbi:MAG TPA: 3'-5' exonuclease [Pseudonocardiaceae bacterium]|jgi:DNA polymerase-3 subunit epsilon|nr:3'-5' exonuclease [Pseudonocardiaceae bacterium]
MPTFFQSGIVTRAAYGIPAREVEWAAIDIETTGLEPRRNRIVEIGIVRFRGDGTIIDEYCTLINPQRRMGAGDIHQLTGRDVADAPVIAEVWPDVIRMLSGTVALAHNLSFEDGILTAESARLFQSMPMFPGVCSLETTRAQLDGKTFKLMSLHKTFTGQWIEDQHIALGDARALASTWTAMLNQAPTQLFYQGPPPSIIALAARPMGRITPRPVEVSSPRLGEFTRRFPRCSVEYRVAPQALQEYLAALRVVVDDEVITLDESTGLAELARRAGLTQQALEAAHRQVWDELTAASTDAGPQPRAEQQRRQRLATNLGLTGSTRLSPEQSAELDAAALQPKPERYLRDWRIGIDPAPETEPLATLASSHGASIAKRLTTSVRWVATTDPKSDTPSLIKARSLGLTIITATEAKVMIDQQISTAQADEAEQIKAAQRWQQERQEREQLFRHTWLPMERPRVAGNVMPNGDRRGATRRTPRQPAPHEVVATVPAASMRTSGPPTAGPTYPPVRPPKRSWWQRLFRR